MPTPRKRSRSTAKPKSALPAPSYLSKAEAEVWRSVVATLSSRGILEPSDAGLVEAYVSSLVRLRRLNAEIRDAKSLRDEDGKLISPLRLIEATITSVKNCAHALGLNPSSRKAQGTPSKGSGIWGDVLK